MSGKRMVYRFVKGKGRVMELLDPVDPVKIKQEDLLPPYRRIPISHTNTTRATPHRYPQRLPATTNENDEIAKSARELLELLEERQQAYRPTIYFESASFVYITASNGYGAGPAHMLAGQPVRVVEENDIVQKSC